MRVALVLAIALLAPARADASTVLASGTLTDASGLPAPGAVRVYAWPHSSRARKLPLAGTAQAGAGGQFTVFAGDTARLLELAAQRGGWLDFTAEAETASGRGEWTFTCFVARTRAGVRVASDDDAAATRAAAARVASPAREPRIAIRADRRSSLLATAARSRGPRCRNERQVTAPRYMRPLAVVGELNNAYNDGTRGTFAYGREHSADTEFGVAMSSDNGSSWSIGGETTSATTAASRSRLRRGATRASCARCSSSATRRRATTPARCGTTTSARRRGSAARTRSCVSQAPSTAATPHTSETGSRERASSAARATRRFAGRVGVRVRRLPHDTEWLLGERHARIRLRGTPAQAPLSVRSGRQVESLRSGSRVLRGAQMTRAAAVALCVGVIALLAWLGYRSSTSYARAAPIETLRSPSGSSAGSGSPSRTVAGCDQFGRRAGGHREHRARRPDARAYVVATRMSGSERKFSSFASGRWLIAASSPTCIQCLASSCIRRT